jgi:hypothetical protein
LTSSLKLERRLARSVLALAVALTLLPATAARASVPTSDCSIGADNPTGSLVVVAGSSNPFGGTRVRTFTVEMEDGIGLDGASLAEQVQNVLGDPRSWIHQGEPGWQRVDSNSSSSRLPISPADSVPQNTGGIHSCRNGNRTILNTYRWRSGTPE